MTIIGKLLIRLGKRQLHTIISRETIKPSSPTPSHLQNYNLSEMDLLNQKSYTPLLLFYPNNRDFGITAHEKATTLKKSLSQSLTQYYPFAGRLPSPDSTYVDCNDEGVLFLEARNDGRLDAFRRMSWDDETLHQLFADDFLLDKNTSSRNPVGVQLNHFSCGGLGLAVSLSRGVGDGCTLDSFLSHWASLARYGSTDHHKVLPLNPHFIHHPRIHPTQPEAKPRNTKHQNDLASRKFVFPNSKLSDLKNKVAFATTESINNPTRVEVLTSLLYKTAVAAATTKSGCFKPSYLFFMVNVRDKFVPKLPQSTVGTCVKAIMIESRDRSETSISMVVGEIRKKKLQLEGIQSVQQLVEDTKFLMGKMGNENDPYWCSSFCGFPFNKLDFGWGKPMGTTIAIRSSKSEDRNGFVMMDTAADGDGIEVMMFLEKECMEIFENDEEMLSYCQI